MTHICLMIEVFLFLEMLSFEMIKMLSIANTESQKSYEMESIVLCKLLNIQGKPQKIIKINFSFLTTRVFSLMKSAFNAKKNTLNAILTRQHKRCW